MNEERPPAAPPTPTALLGRLAHAAPWWLGAMLGIAAAAIGAYLLVRPLSTLSVLTLYLGLGFIASGLVGIIAALNGSSTARSGTLAWLSWLGSVILGVVVLLWFDRALELIAPVVSIGLLVTGVVAIIGSVRGTAPHRFTGLVLGVADVLFGLTALFWPDATLLLLVVVFGVRMIFFGVVIAVRAVITRFRAKGSPRAAWASRPWVQAVSAFVLLALALGAVATSQFLRTGSPTLDAFYTAPAGDLGAPGTLLRTEPFERDVPDDAQGWRILYTTTLAGGEPGVASALVVAPIASAAAHPVVAWAHGTTGYATGCAPSVLEEPFWSGAMFGLDEAIAEGWAVVATDYPGLGTAGNQPYLIGNGAAYAVLDAVRAARQLDGLSLDQRTAVWGHSQGGHAALWTAQLAPDYAPDVPIVGVAALAPAADALGLTESLPTVTGGSVFASFVIAAYSTQYADVSFDRYVTPSARVLVREMSARCLSERGTLVSVLSALSLSRDRPIFGDDPTTGPLGARLVENTPTGPFAMPVLLGQGGADPLITPSLQSAYVARLCAAGVALEYREYAGLDHMGLVSEGSSAPAEVIEWTAARFAGIAPPVVLCATS